MNRESMRSRGSLLLCFALLLHALSACSSGTGIDCDETPLAPECQIPPDTSRPIVADTVRIPADSVHTVTAVATIGRNDKHIVIEGTVTGDCQQITIRGLDITIKGAIHNGCPNILPDEEPPPLMIIGNGNMTLDGASISSSGDIIVQNDPSLTDENFPEHLAPVRGLVLDSVPYQIAARNTTIFQGGSPTGPEPARNGRDGGKVGEKGPNGRAVALTWRGNVVFGGGVVLYGQDAGRGGDAFDTDAPANARGGNGGDGGTIRVKVDGKISWTDGGNVLISGSGGDGGDAVATASAGAAEDAPDATAVGGGGGEPGTIVIRATGTIGPGLNFLELNIGNAGDGGSAQAKGADGAICMTWNPGNSHGQHGGKASATGGTGGSVSGKLQAIGSVILPPNPEVTGGHAGYGGDARVIPGNGADGASCDCRDGGTGGTGTANGGNGGSSELRDRAGNLVGDGGDGGYANFGHANGAPSGNGGHAFLDCCDNADKRGGNGGQGGNAEGMSGMGGTGLTDGAPGRVQLIEYGNGGNAGKGLPAGMIGMPGLDPVTGPRLDPIGEVLMPGEPAGACPDLEPPVAPPGGDIGGLFTETINVFVGNVGDCPPPLAAGAQIGGFQVLFDEALILNKGNRITTEVAGPYIGPQDPPTELDGTWTGTGFQDIGDGFGIKETWTGKWFKDEGIGRVWFEGRKEIEYLEGAQVFCSEVYLITLERS